MVMAEIEGFTVLYLKSRPGLTICSRRMCPTMSVAWAASRVRGTTNSNVWNDAVNSLIRFGGRLTALHLGIDGQR